MALERFELFLPRNAFNPREVARAGDVWRTCQDAAVWGSARRGWPPDRYRREKCGFIVRRMTVVHHRGLMFGDPVSVETWVGSFARGMITNREIRLSVRGEPVVSAAQEWVFVAVDGASVRPSRAPAAITDAFVVEAREGLAARPSRWALPGGWAPAVDARWHEMAFPGWYSWMDQLAHANHPLYVDWGDEAMARVYAASGGSPWEVEPVAEELFFKSGILAPEQVTVRTAAIGLDTAGDAVFHQQVLGGDGRLCSSATLVRRLAGGDSTALLAAFQQ